MDANTLIHADQNGIEMNEIRRINDFDAVVDITEKSDWSLILPADEWAINPIEIDHYIFINGTEWGGPVKRLKTHGNTVELGGPLWRGLLQKNIIMPPAGQAYRIVTGVAKAAISSLIDDHFGTLFSVIDGDIVTVNEQLRFQDVGSGIQRMLERAGARLEIVKVPNPNTVTLAAKKIKDWSQQYELNEDYGAVLLIERDESQAVNHIVALGKGELANRMVLEAWLLPDGAITYNAAAAERPTGFNEVTYKLDYPNVESEDELRDKIVETFAERRKINRAEINLNDVQAIVLNVGDIIASRDRLTGAYAKAIITRKIYKIGANGLPVMRYEIAGGN